MRILLLGEFSGFYKNLSEGLVSSGHEVDVISTGDSWKKIGNVDNRLFSSRKNNYINFLESMYLQMKNVGKIEGYDIVQLVSPNIFSLHNNNNSRILKKIKKQNKKMFLSVAGDHYYIYKLAQKLRYNTYQDQDIKSEDIKYTQYKYIENNKKIVGLVDGIIPVMYTYAEAYRWNEKLLNTIPLPINTDKIKYTPQHIENNKIKIFHGINREKDKGTKYIREAMKRIKADYPNDVEITIDGKMPLNQYITVLNEANIVIDQVLSYEYGMNALYAMAMGKVVLSGNEPESQKEFGRDDIPVINILPSADDIYNKLEELVLNKESVVEIGKKSRWFVEDFHDHVKVAQQYVNAWKSVEDD